MNADPEAVARFLAYCEKPKPFPLSGFYRLLGYTVPDYLPRKESK